MEIALISVGCVSYVLSLAFMYALGYMNAASAMNKAKAEWAKQVMSFVRKVYDEQVTDGNNRGGAGDAGHSLDVQG